MRSLQTRMVRALFLLAAATSIAACGGKEEREAMHMEKGIAYFKAGNFEKARVELRNVLQIDPRNAGGYALLGLIEEEQQNWQAAFASYQKAVELDPNHLDANVRLGRLYLLSGRLPQAESIMVAVLARKPDDSGGRFLKAAILLRKGEKAAAIREASEVVALAPTQTDSISLLAGIYSGGGDHDKAEAVLQKGVEANPRNVALHVDLAAVAFKRNDLGRAEREHLAVVALEPQSLRHRVTLADFYIATNQLDKAEKALRDTIKADPDDWQRYGLLADFMAARRTIDDAERELRSAIEAQPRAYELRFRLARLYETAGRAARAEQVYRDVIATAKLRPEGLRARSLLARTKAAAGQQTEAEKLLAEVLAENPRDSDALRLRAQLALARGDAKQSVADLRSVLRDHPESIELVSLLAAAHIANNEPQLAKDVVDGAIARYPDNAGLRVTLAEMLASRKDYQAALNELDSALAADPRNANAFQAKAYIHVAKGDWRGAEETLINLKTALPAQPVGYYRLGLLYQSRKKYEQAIAEFESALRLAPQASEPLAAIVNTLVEQGKADKAIARLNAVMQATPDSAIPRVLLANVFARQKKYADAELALRKAMEINAEAPAAYAGLANLYAVRGDTKGAVDVLQQGRSSAAGGGPLQLSYALAEIYQGVGDRQKAIAEYEAILNKDPRADAAANNLASLLSENPANKADLERALALAKRFENTAVPSFADTLGWIYFLSGDYDRALPLLQKAVAAANQSPVFHYHLGMLMYKRGDIDAARKHLMLAVQGKATFPGSDEASQTLQAM